MTQLSKTEYLLFEKLKKENLEIFRTEDICNLLNVSKTKAYNIAKSLKRKKAIKKYKRFFVFSETDELAIASGILSPSYISFWSALGYYGLSDNFPKRIFVANPKLSTKIQNIKYIKILPKRFFGYRKIGEKVIAEKEKAIIDCLFLPRYCGGIKEIEKAIQNKLNIKKLIEYAIRFNSKAVIRRLGYLLEKNKINAKKLKKHIGKGYEVLDPALKKKNNLNKIWLLDINA
jgi:predicted transcriptional regulator of viral defense system